MANLENTVLIGGSSSPKAMGRTIAFMGSAQNPETGSRMSSCQVPRGDEMRERLLQGVGLLSGMTQVFWKQIRVMVAPTLDFLCNHC